MKPQRARQVAHLRHNSKDPTQGNEHAVTSLDGYVRVSRVGGRSGERFISPDVQEEQIRAYAAARGHTIDTVFCELDRSGTTLDRPLLQSALARIESRQSGGLIVARLDRFARTALEALEAIGRIQQAGGEFISVEDGLDSSTAFGKAMMTILLALAELEVGRVRENWRSAKTHAVLRGVHVTGRLPFGYQRDAHGRLQPIAEQQQALRDAYIQRGFGALPGQIVETLRAAGIRDPDGNPVTLRRANYLLRNPVYIGEARCGEQINPTAHPPIVSHSIWIAAQDPRTRTSFNRNVKTLLAGLTRCNTCGSPLKRRQITTHNPAWHPHTDYAYFCWQRQRHARCPARSCIANSILEPFVVNAFFGWLEQLDRPAAKARLATEEASVVQADTNYAHTLAFSALDTARATTKKASEQAWLKLAAIARLALVLELPDPETLRHRWPTMTVTQQRQLLAAAIDTITVSAADASPARRRTRIRFVGDPTETGSTPPRGRKPYGWATAP